MYNISSDGFNHKLIVK